jgi:hypothetical protein
MSNLRSRTASNRTAVVLALLISITSPGVSQAAIKDVPLKNPDFHEGTSADGVPAGWSRYGGGAVNQRLAVTRDGLIIQDGDPAREVGVIQTVPVEPGKSYEVRVSVRAVPGATCEGAFVQLRFLPSQQSEQAGLDAASTSEFYEVSIAAAAPPGTKAAQIYLYTLH